MAFLPRENINVRSYQTLRASMRVRRASITTLRHSSFFCHWPQKAKRRKRRQIAPPHRKCPSQGTSVGIQGIGNYRNLNRILRFSNTEGSGNPLISAITELDRQAQNGPLNMPGCYLATFTKSMGRRFDPEGAGKAKKPAPPLLFARKKFLTRLYQEPIYYALLTSK